MRYLVIVSIMLIVQSSSITASSEEGFGVGPTQEDGHNRGSETSKFGSSTETGEGEFSAASSGLVGVGSVRPATKTRAKAPEVAVADPLTAPPVAPAVLERVASPAKTEAPQKSLRHLARPPRVLLKNAWRWRRE